MRNRSTLSLIELAVMMAVFALAAALCVRAFLWSDTQSRSIESRDRALVQAQNACEILKHCRGDLEAAAEAYGGQSGAGVWRIDYDAAFQPSDTGAAFYLIAAPVETEQPLLGSAVVTVYAGETKLAELTAAWQEVAGDA